VQKRGLEWFEEEGKGLRSAPAKNSKKAAANGHQNFRESVKLSILFRIVGAGAGADAGAAGSRVLGVTFRTLLQPILLLFAHKLDLAILWCVLDGLKRILEREREESERKIKGRAHRTTYV
jgi:hypothetical protein